MKKLLIVLMMASFALGACGKKQAPAKPDDKTMTPPADPNAPKPDEPKPEGEKPADAPK